MKIKEIYKMQEELDNSIIIKKNLNVDAKTLLNTRLLALYVELGEFEEERRKYFANNTGNVMGSREIRDKAREKALEEYVDCMHFVFSIANALDLQDYIKDYDLKDSIYVPNKSQFIIILSNFANYIGNWKYWKAQKEHDKSDLYFEWQQLLDSFIRMGINSLPSFNINEIEEAYKSKMKKNYERQENNY